MWETQIGTQRVTTAWGGYCWQTVILPVASGDAIAAEYDTEEEARYGHAEIVERLETFWEASSEQSADDEFDD